MSKIEHLTCKLVEVKAEGDASNDMGMFDGYGSIFGNIDQGGDIVQGGAFSKSLMDWKSRGEMPSLFGFHEFDNPIGDWLEMREDEKGLYVKGKLWVKSDQRIEEAVKCYNMITGTGPRGLSIGYRVKDYEIQDYEGGRVRILKEIDLLEVSIVGHAMNREAMVTNVKNMTGEDGQLVSKREVEKTLRDAGLSSRQAKAFISGGYDAASRDEKSHDLSSVLASLDQLSTILKG